MLRSKLSKTSTISKASLLLPVGVGSKRGKPTERLGHKATGLKPHKRGYGSRVANRAQFLPNAVTFRSQRGAHEVQFKSDPHLFLFLRGCSNQLAQHSSGRPASVKLGR